MKFSAQEEYGLRCLLQIARQGPGGGLTIPEIASAEGLSVPYVAKLVRILRQGGFLNSTRGHSGGYALSGPADEIEVGEVLAVLGGRLYESGHCEHYTGAVPMCTHNLDCSIRSLWEEVQRGVDQVLSRTTLTSLLADEHDRSEPANRLVQIGGTPQLSNTI
ncbi:MAG: Rrf2 family transcriptional regulator [Acidobacteria bacterium]|nr:Rrf2 family transcriptional regulator [Acidobacteriota bacterium]